MRSAAYRRGPSRGVWACGTLSHMRQTPASTMTDPDEVMDAVIAGLEAPGPYRDPALAAEMRRVHDGGTRA